MAKSFDQGGEPGRQLEVDLRLIREDRGVSIEDIHQKTKIPLEVLGQFEQGALTEEPQFNRVYLRAIVRTYADLLDIEHDLALASLEESFRGRYAGQLAVEYLGIPPVHGVESVFPKEEEPVDIDVEAGDESQEEEPEPFANVEHANRPVYEVDVRPVVNWGRVALVIIAIAALGLIIWIAISRGTSNDEGGDVQQIATHEPQETLPPVQLGPTLNLLIFAEQAPLGPIRARLDEGTLTPYWVEQGDSLRLTANDRFELSGNLGAARVVVEGVQWATAGLGPGSTISITRNEVQTRLEVGAGRP